jgi:hypothetical protein
MFELLIGLLILVIGLILSFAIACGIIFLITLCFGWKFSWPIACGVWLIMCLLSATFKSRK